MKKQISKIFSSDGELSKNIKGFKPRAEQLEMAQSVGYAIPVSYTHLDVYKRQTEETFKSFKDKKKSE